MAELSIARSRYTPTHGVSLGKAFRVWTKVALLSFGGPAGQIAVMHRLLVEEKKWISESRFLHALNYCMLVPGILAAGSTMYSLNVTSLHTMPEFLLASL